MSCRAATTAVCQAIKSGRLVRPSSCEECGREPPLMRSGVTGICGHHADYSKPLSVEWLCRSCHLRRHRRKPWINRTKRLMLADSIAKKG